MDNFIWKPLAIFGFVMAAATSIAVRIMAWSYSGSLTGGGFGPAMISGGFFWIFPILGFS